MLISVRLIRSSPSFETDVSRRCRFFLMTSSSDVVLLLLLDDESLELVVEAAAIGFWLEPRDGCFGVDSLTSFEGVEERDVEASSRLDSLERRREREMLNFECEN